MEKTLYETYLAYGFKALLCKGYHLKYAIDGNDHEQRANAKQPVTRGFQKETYKTASYGCCSDWLDSHGWVGWVLPKGIIALDVDKDMHSIRQIDKYLRENRLTSCIHSTRNGKHYFFKTREEIKTTTSALIKQGLDQITYRIGGINYLILEPMENDRKWVNLDAWNDSSYLPKRFLPVDVTSQDELLQAIAYQLSYYYGVGALDGYSIDMAFIGFLVKDLNLKVDAICALCACIFGESYDERKTILMCERVEEREAVQKVGTLVDVLSTLKLENVVKLLGHISRIDTSKSDIKKIVQDFNKDFFIVNFSGRVRYCESVFKTSMNTKVLNIYDRESFELIHATKKPLFTMNKTTGKITTKKQTEVWRTHPDRRFYTGLTYEPGLPDIVAGQYNLWSGFAYKPVQGDCSLYLEHIKNIVCSGNEEQYKFVLIWLADAVQNLRTRTGVALCIRGKQGTGKGVFVSHFGKLFGQHYLQINGDEPLVTNFNSELTKKSILFADEVIFAGDHKTANKLKGFITEPTMRVEYKGVEAFTMPNYLRLIIASNNDWVTNVEKSDRRYFILTIDDSKIKNYKYFNAIQAQMDSGGYEALLYFLLQYKITDDLRDYPDTEEIQTQKMLSMSVFDEFITSLLGVGDFNDFCNMIEFSVEITGMHPESTWLEYIRINEMYQLFVRWCKYKNKRYLENDAVFGRKLTNVFAFRKFRPSFNIGGVRKQKSAYVLFPVEECKRIFAGFLGYSPFDNVENTTDDVFIGPDKDKVLF